MPGQGRLLGRTEEDKFNCVVNRIGSSFEELNIPCSEI